MSAAVKRNYDYFFSYERAVLLTWKQTADDTAEDVMITGAGVIVVKVTSVSTSLLFDMPTSSLQPKKAQKMMTNEAKNKNW